MGKGSGKAIAVIALCISLGLGGYIVYDKLIISTGDTTPITTTSNQYFKAYYGDSYVLVGFGFWLTVQDLFIEFNITQGESVYFSYLGQAHLAGVASDTYLEFRFQIDDIRMDAPTCRIERYGATDPGELRVDASLQHYNSTMTPGTHNVTIAYRGRDTSNYISPQSLFVQTFK